MNVKPLFKLMVEKNASDLFFAPFAPAKIKIEGKIMPVNKLDLTPKMIKQAALELMTEEQMEEFTRELEVDFAFPTQTLHIDSLAAAGEATEHEVPDDEALEAKVLAFAPGGKLSRPAGPRITHGFFPGAEVKGSDQQDSGGEG